MLKKTPLTVTMVLPSFFQSQEVLLTNLLADDERKWALKSMRVSNRTHSGVLLYDLAMEQSDLSPPYAALSALGNGLDAQNGWWLQVDPVELLVDGGNICLLGRDHIQLSDIESATLLKTINELISEDALEIVSGNTADWYLRLTEAPDIETIPMAKVIAKDIRAFLPSGNRHRYWNKLLTEIQMLFFEHEVNRQRQIARLPQINSVWFWGEGMLSDTTINSPESGYRVKQFDAIWNDYSLLSGLVQLVSNPPLLRASADFESDAIVQPGNYLLAVNHHLHLAETLRSWLSSLLNAVRKKKLHQFNLYLGDGTCLTWKKRKFW